MTEHWPISWFRSPGLTEPTPLTIDNSGRVFGHAALWNSQHMSFPGRNITPPRSKTDYREFHVGATTVIGDDGAETEISVGTLVMGSGHAGTSLSAADTASFYDTSSTVAAVCCAGEDEVGLWVAGALMDDLDEVSIKRLRACAISGDWRSVPGSGLTLIALLAVSTPGFPIPRARVASGAPLSLVAAGVLAQTATFGRRVDPTWVPAALPEDVTPVSTGAVVLDYDTLADAIAGRLDERRQAGELAARHADLVSELDDTPAVVASLLAEVDDTPQVAARLFAELADESFGGDADPKGLTA